MRADVGCVVVNYRDAHDTLRYLESLLAADPAPGVLAVVDNDSRDGSVDAIEGWERERAVPLAVVRETDLGLAPPAPLAGPSGGAGGT